MINANVIWIAMTTNIIVTTSDILNSISDLSTRTTAAIPITANSKGINVNIVRSMPVHVVPLMVVIVNTLPFPAPVGHSTSILCAVIDVDWTAVWDTLVWLYVPYSDI